MHNVAITKVGNWMTERRAAEVFPPSEFILDEMEARHWDTYELSNACGLSFACCRELLEGRIRITETVAAELEKALGASADYWLNLQSAYDAAQLDSSHPASQHP